MLETLGVSVDMWTLRLNNLKPAWGNSRQPLLKPTNYFTKNYSKIDEKVQAGECNKYISQLIYVSN
jgi:hypothetical protein